MISVVKKKSMLDEMVKLIISIFIGVFRLLGNNEED